MEKASELKRLVNESKNKVEKSIQEDIDSFLRGFVAEARTAALVGLNSFERAIPNITKQQSNALVNALKAAGYEAEIITFQNPFNKNITLTKLRIEW